MFKNAQKRATSNTDGVKVRYLSRNTAEVSVGNQSLTLTDNGIPLRDAAVRYRLKGWCFKALEALSVLGAFAGFALALSIPGHMDFLVASMAADTWGAHSYLARGILGCTMMLGGAYLAKMSYRASRSADSEADDLAREYQKTIKGL